MSNNVKVRESLVQLINESQSLDSYMDPRLCEEPSQTCADAIVFQKVLGDVCRSLGISYPFRLVRRLPCEGLLKRINDRYFIEVKEESPPSRRLFTVFHEIAHRILADDVGRSLRAEGGVDEEKLCDKLAADLLIPNHSIGHLLNWDLITIKEAQRTAAKLRVSLTALLRKIVSCLGGTGGFIWFREMPKPTDLNDVALRVESGFFPEGARIFIPKYDSVPKGTLIHEMWDKKVLDEWVGVDRLDFGSLRGERLIRGKVLKNRMLVIIYPEGYVPRSLGQHSQAKITDCL